MITLLLTEKLGFICLSIDNTFSVFPSTKPTADDIYDTCNPLVLITPEGSWDPTLTEFQQRERALMDYEGDIVE